MNGTTSRLSRGDFLALVALGGAALALPSCGGAAPGEREAEQIPPAPTGSKPVLDVALKAAPGRVALLPGRQTNVWAYRGQLLRGDPQALQKLPGSYLGPVIRADRGQRLRIRFRNELPEPTIVHWHGLRVPPRMDGHPKDAVPPGGEYTYEFDVIDRAGTYWFHAHPHRRTGPQIYFGLAGLLLVSDPEEQALDLPAGDYDLPLVIQDRAFDRSNQLRYETGGGMMGGRDGFLGDRVLVNGRPNFALAVAARAYRLRLVNGSNSRIYRLGWDDQTPLTVIGTDCGLVAEPLKRPFVMLAPGERIELWADFGRWRVGSEHRLLSLPFADRQFGGVMGGGMMGSTAPPNGSQLMVLTVRVERAAAGEATLPHRLGAIGHEDAGDAVNAGRPRRFTVARRHMTWTINGRVFEMDDVADDEIVRLNALEVWEFENPVDGMGMMGGMGMGSMAMAHPIHIHGVQFRVLDRQSPPELAAVNATIQRGYVDVGWKDTVLVTPGERVRLLIRFAGYGGTYLYHCHNLEHADAGMMRNYRIVA